jgi:ATP-dependent helicase/nuclease subunit B
MLLSRLNNKEQLFLLLAQETTVLTPNNRLSDSILHSYFIQSTNQIVDKPQCMPYRVALIKAYEQHNYLNPHKTHPTLLNEAQCQHLWRQIIQSHTHITYSEGLLKAVMSAWERCQHWQIHDDNPTFNYTNQTQLFQQWWQLFAAQLKQQNFITEYQLIPYLLNANSLLFSQDVIWACFDDFTPQQLQLQEHLHKKGFAQYQYDLEEKLTTTEVLAAQDNKEEYQQLMAWLALKVHEGNQRIGVVVPNLEQESRVLQRIVAHHFKSNLYNISLGQSLSTYSLVAHALCWLNLDDAYISAHQANLLLQSPYLGGSKEEFMARSEYLQESTLLEKPILALTTFIEKLQPHTPILAQLLNNISPYPPIATVQGWILLFQERLNNLGFPGEYGLNSENYQCFNRFIILFDELRQLALLNSSLTKSDALSTLRFLTENTIFQAQKNNATIQISGLLEASGCEFDSLWVMSLTDQCLPKKVQLSAFIPPQLQRELYMPHSLPARELQFAQHMIQRLQRSASSVVFSYAQLQGDNPNLPCSLISKLPQFARLPLDPKQVLHLDLLSIEEDFTIPLRSAELVSGGTAILTNQAKCPFKAFAEHRLRARALLETADGLDNKERGQIIHKVMELLWQMLKDQQKLLHLAPDILEQHIDKAIDSALAPLKQQLPDLFSDFIRDVEHTRLKRLVYTCLDWEKQRPAFTVSALEQSYSINLAGLDLQVRVDRLDQVADKKWVIDYKSSLPLSKPWNEDRPKESQLLLYALLDQQINTLLFMQLKNGKISCAGLSEEKQSITGISSLKKEETWTMYRDTWQQQLTDLASEFIQGQCAPQPAQTTLCQQCNFQNLCRFQAER